MAATPTLSEAIASPRSNVLSVDTRRGQARSSDPPTIQEYLMVLQERLRNQRWFHNDDSIPLTLHRRRLAGLLFQVSRAAIQNRFPRLTRTAPTQSRCHAAFQFFVDREEVLDLAA